MARWCYKVASLLPVCWKQLLDYFLLRGAMGWRTELGTICAWSQKKGIKRSLLGKMQPACSTAVFECYKSGNMDNLHGSSEKGSVSLQQRALAQNPLFLFSPLQESGEAWLCGVWWLWHFLCHGSARSGQGGRVIIPSVQHLAGSILCPLEDQHRGQRFLTGEVKHNYKLGESMTAPVMCTQTNPQRLISAQGTNPGGGSRPWRTRRYHRISASMTRALSHGCGTVTGWSQIFGEVGLQSWLRQWINHPVSTFHWLVFCPVNALLTVHKCSRRY